MLRMRFWPCKRGKRGIEVSVGRSANMGRIRETAATHHDREANETNVGTAWRAQVIGIGQ